MARKNDWPLDKMAISVDVTKKQKDDFGHAPREGAYLHGLFLEGAQWDTQTGEAKLNLQFESIYFSFSKCHQSYSPKI